MQIVLLIIALSVDVFMASIACGAEHITIGKRTALCISGICSGVLFLSLVLGKFLQGVIQGYDTKWICFIGLFVIGAFKLGEYGVKCYVRRRPFYCKRVKISIAQIQLILSIYNNPTEADKDHSSSMSVPEGIFFALAMSLDGFFGGLGASFLGIDLWVTSILNFLLGFVAVRMGSCLGKRMVEHHARDFSWVGGVLFLCLAFSKII